MSYSTVAELKAFIGTTANVSGILDADLTILLNHSMHEIDAKLVAEDVSIPASSDSLKAAELNLTLNRVVTRGKIDNTLTDGEGSAGDYAVYDLDSSIYIFYTRGWEIVDMYIKDARRDVMESRDIIKVNG